MSRDYPQRRKTLEEAIALIVNDRNSDYGEPEDNFGRIASFWSTYLEREVTMAQVADMMTLLKMARLVHQPDHHDSRVDAAGYLAIGDELR